METIGNNLETLETAPGNTKIRCVPSKRWCFTSFENNLETMETLFLENKCEYIIGIETCPSTNKTHLQGYIESPIKIRPIEKFKTTNIHWEKCKGSREDNIKYCSKEENYKTTFKLRKKIIDPLEGKELFPFQKEILEITNNTPDDRSIYWFWETNGNKGKTSIAKHLCMHKNALYLSGKSADIKYAIAEYLENNELDIVILDFVRSLEEYISYEAIESIKNGIFFSGKYEGKMCIFNPPHVICLANFEPHIEALSKDRWIIKNLQ